MMPHKQESLHVYRYSASAHSSVLTLANSAFNHGDDAMHKIQTHLYAKYYIASSAAHLAKANEYLLRLRILKACIRRQLPCPVHFLCVALCRNGVLVPQALFLNTGPYQQLAKVWA
jgi:hypothetical protein